jgi:hypothetical protein
MKKKCGNNRNENRNKTQRENNGGMARAWGSASSRARIGVRSRIQTLTARIALARRAGGGSLSKAKVIVAWHRRHGSENISERSKAAHLAKKTEMAWRKRRLISGIMSLAAKAAAK